VTEQSGFANGTDIHRTDLTQGKVKLRHFCPLRYNDGGGRFIPAFLESHHRDQFHGCSNATPKKRDA
jgi:hypothetical protein